MKPWWNSFKIAFSMYSKVPMPKSEWTKENMRYIMCLFPLIGVIIGAVTWLWGYWGLQITQSHLFYSVVPGADSGGDHRRHSSGRASGYLRCPSFLSATGAETGDIKRFSRRCALPLSLQWYIFYFTWYLQRDDFKSPAGGLHRLCSFQGHGGLFYCRFSNGKKYRSCRYFF